MDPVKTHPVAPSGTDRAGSRRVRALTLGLASALLMATTATTLAQAPTEQPVTMLTDDTGTQVTLGAHPQRVISLSPAITEIVFALGAGDRLVGGTDFDDYPAEAPALPDVATYQGVLMEQLVELEPDLVLASGMGLTPDADIARMRELEYPVVVTYSTSVDDVLVDIRLIGDALGGDADAAAEALTAEMAADLDRIAELAAATGRTPRTFYETGDQPELYGVAPGSFAADMIERAGGEAITTGDPNVWSMPLERLVAADPEVILLGDAAYGTCPVGVTGRPGWGDMTAVQDGAIRPVDDIVVTRPGPRLALGLASVARGIHPELTDQLVDFPAAPDPCAP
ncbi:MAG: ABC transporter substrate-binding protein [Chloroflexi bacterium]|nr:ABC transporter substrate-binding protein [Chloroflexota bacterium]